ncbi:MAG: PAS domain S-box protein [Syntrophomonadaceae bacterium]|jgi:two-component system, sporulation sensor kinase E
MVFFNNILSNRWPRYLLLGLLVMICGLLEVIFSVYLQMEILYTHFFYLPIVLTGIWFNKIAVLMALLLGILHMAGVYLNTGIFPIFAILRSLMFITVAIFVAWLSINWEKVERRLADIINFLPDATFVINREGKVITWNQAAEKMTGIKAKDMLGKGDYEYAIPFYGKRHKTLADQILEDSINMEKNYSGRSKGNILSASKFFRQGIGCSGAFLHAAASPLYDPQGNVAGAIECIRDATAQKKVEEDLRLSEEKFSKAFNSGPSLMTISTLDDGRLLDVNNKTCSTLGMSREELIGQTTLEIGFWKDKNQREEYKQILLRDGSVKNMEYTQNTKNGKKLIGILSSELLDIHGRKCVISSLVDITERVNMQNELLRLDRLNLIGEIAASIGHETRNPMTTVRGFLQMLKDRDSYYRDREYFDIMIEELDRANAIITEFLSLAKNKKVDLELQSLNSIILTLFPLLNSEARATDKEVRLNLQEIPYLLLDQKEIRQLILNLVKNGLDATPAGGAVTIETQAHQDMAVMLIKDEGLGIPLEIIDKVSQPFFTTKENGTGLGLSVCYSIAARHNAIIDIKTGINGTIISVSFKVNRMGCDAAIGQTLA